MGFVKCFIDIAGNIIADTESRKAERKLEEEDDGRAHEKHCLYP